ncbi:hypothetical protein AB2L27_00165 [Kineococcus sp. LSe6-4]|uniref:Ribbon-helix-helix protein, CopG family n=1 Tax=Kineococcus halophytocola TaxID=3234027 RepID=A0ABV4GXK9_9ACTN
MDEMTATTQHVGQGAGVPSAGRSGRLNIRINAATSEALKQLSADDATPTEVVRRAVALLKLVEDRRREGLSVEFVDGDGHRQGRLELLY